MKLQDMDVLSQYWELTAKVLPPNSGSTQAVFKTVTRYESVNEGFSSECLVLPNSR